jgi:hypothetical protein
LGEKPLSKWHMAIYQQIYPMCQQPSCIYAYYQKIQDDFFLNLSIRTFCVFPSILVMQFSYHVL